MKKWSIISLSLLTLTLLAACKPADKERKQESTSSKTSQQASSSQSSSIEVNNSDRTVRQEAPETSIDLQAIANRDFSSISGTYEVSDGSYTIAADGTFTYSKSDGDLTFPITDGAVQNGMAVLTANSITFYVIPAGLESPVTVPEFLGPDDRLRDRVIISGEGMNFFFLD